LDANVSATHDASAHAAHDVGPLSEEATRLVEALSEWARGRLGPSAGSVGNSAECSLCPICQLLSVVRHAKPETFTHLLDASAAITAALRSVVDAHPTHAPHGGMERIDLDDDGFADPTL
jgi:hypothetical protein